ncbi:MAG: tryptophan synthase alpha chain, partial [Archangiaceae bacterium]|nr:tryptophan synthase alpha chain [Archangiaceae bacterium]
VIPNCGTCPMGQVCGAGGPGRCGSGACVPRTCTQQSLSCGPAGDGCGNLIQCGTCTAPDTCGGGGTPGVCGRTSCQPRTCTQANAACGLIADGCGSTVNCGNCIAPLTCGGGGVPNQCGGIM